MNNKSFLVLVFLWGFISLPVHSMTLDKLINNQALNIHIRMQEGQAARVRQAITFEIEVATNRWFAKGTRIKTFELANTLIMPLNDVSINGSKRSKGKTWVMQTREITLYALSSGLYEMPSIPVFVSVNTATAGNVEGIIYTQPFTFEVSDIPELKSYSQYIVSHAASLNINKRLSHTLGYKEGYKVGDAITQRIEFSADSVPAQLLPKLKVPNVKGISIYEKPEQLENKNNRGMLTGKRTQELTYIFEEAGDYTLPEQRFIWWDTENKEMTELIIPVQTWSVSNNGMLSINSEITEHTWLKIKKWVYLELILLALFILIISAQGRFHIFENSSHKKPYFFNLRQAYETRRDFLKAVKLKDYNQAMAYLYELHLAGSSNRLNEGLSKGSINRESLKNILKKNSYSEADLHILDTLLVLAYGKESDAKKLLSTKQARCLLPKLLSGFKFNQKIVGQVIGFEKLN